MRISCKYFKIRKLEKEIVRLYVYVCTCVCVLFSFSFFGQYMNF